MMYDPNNPSGMFVDPFVMPQTKQEQHQDAVGGCLYSVAACVAIAVLAIMCALLSSCSSQRPVTTTAVDQHHLQTLVDRIDSLMHFKSVTETDSIWRETVLRQFQSIREKSDTSHLLVTDTAGRVIQEKIVINNVREVTSETDRQEIQKLSSRIETMDSTMNLMRQQLERSDSLLQSRHDTEVREVEKPLSWWQQARLWLGNIVLVALAVLAGWWLVKKHTWWLALLRKIL